MSGGRPKIGGSDGVNVALISHTCKGALRCEMEPRYNTLKQKSLLQSMCFISLRRLPWGLSKRQRRGYIFGKAFFLPFSAVKKGVRGLGWKTPANNQMSWLIFMAKFIPHSGRPNARGQSVGVWINVLVCGLSSTYYPDHKPNSDAMIASLRPPAMRNELCYNHKP